MQYFAAVPKSVILSERSESKDLRTNGYFCSQITAKILRLPMKIFDFLRSLRMTYRFGVLQFMQHAFSIKNGRPKGRPSLGLRGYAIAPNA